MHARARPARVILSEFLKDRRGRLLPRDFGLPVHPHRRLRGLRREEVAALAGVGATWYGLLESGKPIHVSRQLVESVGRALRLSDDEMRYLQSLASLDDYADVDYERAPVAETVRAALDALLVPAFVMSPRLDYLAVNEPARVLYRLTAATSSDHYNLPLRLFCDPAAPTLYPDWESSAVRVASKLRTNYGQHVGNASFERLIARLVAQSAAFAELWARHDVAAAHEPVSDALGTPDGRRFRYRLQSFAVTDAEEQTLVVMLPLESDDERLLRSLLS
jgi:hypothetical protein